MNDFNLQKEGLNAPQTNEVLKNAGAMLGTADTDTAPSPTFSISEYKNCKDNVPKAKSHTWDSFCGEFSNHLSRKEKDGPAWSPAKFIPNSTRKNESVEHVSLAVIDVDDGTPVEMVLQRIAGYACLVHSSYSHTEGKPKYRMVLPFEQPIPTVEWPVVWARVNQLAGGCNDPATKDPARLYYKPAHPVGTNDHFVKIVDGHSFRLDDLPELSSAISVHPMTFLPRGTYKPLTEIDGIESSGPELGFAQGLTEVVNRCEFMRFASAQENQEHISEPHWMAMISNACRFIDSEQWIHSASEHHPEYSEQDTGAKIERLQNGAPPITCQRIRELGFRKCPHGGCKLPCGEVTKAPAGLYGWMFHHQLTAAEATAAEMPEEYSVGNFLVKPHGVYEEKTNKDGETNQIRLCSRIDVVALTRDHDSSNWGMELRFTDLDDKTKNWALPKELLASQGESYRASLLKMGASIELSKQAREGLAGYLVAAMPEARALSVRQPGWFNGAFILPDAVYGNSKERVVFQTNDPDEIKRFSQKGSLESWQQNVAIPCLGNSRAVASICIGLAPPLLALLGEDNGAFHFRGNSSIGKSICLALGSSVWGGSALIRTWNMTVNGFEGVVAMHNDVLLPLDELGQANGKDAGETAYMLGNGQGKSRAGRDGEAKTPKRFRTIALSSGEKSLADLLAQTGQLAMAGQEVRMVDIPADAGLGYGVFENIHGAKTSQVFAEALKHAVTQHHGFAGRAFVTLLADMELQPQLIEKLKALIQKFVDTTVDPKSTGQVGRVGRRFGLVAAAGELCIELGILPWPEGAAFDACKKCFEAWILQRGGIGNHEEAQAIAQVRRFIEIHGESRFTPWQDGVGENNGLGKTINRAGFRRVTDDGRTEFFILPEAYKTEICAGLNPKYVTSVLLEKGFLAVDRKGEPYKEVRLPGIDKKRVYHLTADFLGGVSQTEIYETVTRQASTSILSTKYIV